MLERRIQRDPLRTPLQNLQPGHVDTIFRREPQRGHWRCGHNGKLLPEMFGEVPTSEIPQPALTIGESGRHYRDRISSLDSARPGAASSLPMWGGGTSET